MSHPSPGGLLELHFGELQTGRAALLSHLETCSSCRALLEEVRGLELALVAGPDDAPPSDGLERVLARVAAVQPARARGLAGARLLAPSGALLLAAAWAIRAGSERLLALDLVPRSVPGPFIELAGLGLAAVAVMGVGSLVTLALAPVLILESQGRP